MAVLVYTIDLFLTKAGDNECFYNWISESGVPDLFSVCSVPMTGCMITVCLTCAKAVSVTSYLNLFCWLNAMCLSGCLNAVCLTSCLNAVCLTGCLNAVCLTGCLNAVCLTDCLNAVCLTGCLNAVCLSDCLNAVPDWFSEWNV